MNISEQSIWLVFVISRVSRAFVENCIHDPVHSVRYPRKYSRSILFTVSDQNSDCIFLDNGDLSYYGQFDFDKFSYFVKWSALSGKFYGPKTRCQKASVHFFDWYRSKDFHHQLKNLSSDLKFLHQSHFSVFLQLQAPFSPARSPAQNSTSSWISLDW